MVEAGFGNSHKEERNNASQADASMATGFSAGRTGAANHMQDYGTTDLEPGYFHHSMPPHFFPPHPPPGHFHPPHFPPSRHLPPHWDFKQSSASSTQASSPFHFPSHQPRPHHPPRHPPLHFPRAPPPPFHPHAGHPQASSAPGMRPWHPHGEHPRHTPPPHIAGMGFPHPHGMHPPHAPGFSDSFFEPHPPPFPPPPSFAPSTYAMPPGHLRPHPTLLDQLIAAHIAAKQQGTPGGRSMSQNDESGPLQAMAESSHLPDIWRMQHDGAMSDSSAGRETWSSFGGSLVSSHSEARDFLVGEQSSPVLANPSGCSQMLTPTILGQLERAQLVDSAYSTRPVGQSVPLTQHNTVVSSAGHLGLGSDSLPAGNTSMQKLMLDPCRPAGQGTGSLGLPHLVATAPMTTLPSMHTTASKPVSKETPTTGQATLATIQAASVVLPSQELSKPQIVEVLKTQRGRIHEALQDGDYGPPELKANLGAAQLEQVHLQQGAGSTSEPIDMEGISFNGFAPAEATLEATKQPAEAGGLEDPNLIAFMQMAGMDEYTPLLTEAWVDMAELLEMSPKELRLLGLPPEVCKKMRTAIRLQGKLVAGLESEVFFQT